MSSPVPSPDHDVGRALPSIEARLRQLFPTVPTDVVQACIADASLEHAGARVRNFLPILIERRASEALRGSTLSCDADPEWMNEPLARRDEVPGEPGSNDRARMFEHELEPLHVEKLRSPTSSRSGDVPAAESQVITSPLIAERGRTR